MRLSWVSQLLLLLISVLALTARAQTSSSKATENTITTSTTVPPENTITTSTTVPPENTITTSTTVPPGNTITTSTTVPPGNTTKSTSGNTITTSTTVPPGNTTKSTLENTITTSTTVPPGISPITAWTAPAIFYPFGAVAGDTEILETGGDTYSYVAFSTPFTFFGRKYNKTYVNNNGLITFNQPLPEALPFSFPSYGAEDYIAPLWTNLSAFGFGKYSYRQYTNGSVLTRASQDINQYFPQRGFTASWVFVATWDYAQTWDLNVFKLRSAPTTTFQMVLISGGGFSFILMNYGDCAVLSNLMAAGFDTINSTDYYVIQYANYGILNLKSMSNVNVPGRWAFLVNNGTENVLGIKLKLSSFIDLTQTENIEDVLQQIKKGLVNYGVSSFEIKLRNVKKTQP